MVPMFYPVPTNGDVAAVWREPSPPGATGRRPVRDAPGAPRSM